MNTGKKYPHKNANLLIYNTLTNNCAVVNRNHLYTESQTACSNFWETEVLKTGNAAQRQTKTI